MLPLVEGWLHVCVPRVLHRAHSAANWLSLELLYTGSPLAKRIVYATESVSVQTKSVCYTPARRTIRGLQVHRQPSYYAALVAQALGEQLSQSSTNAPAGRASNNYQVRACMQHRRIHLLIYFVRACSSAAFMHSFV